jgi:cytochrome c oxidase cbb3-type subunit II
MKNGFAIFFAVLLTLGVSWIGFVVAPTLQLGQAKLTQVLVTGDIWPQQRTGEATLGLQIYRANGCVACHTMQIRQDGFVFEVVLTGAGKINPAAVSNLISTLKLSGLNKEAADAAAEKIKEAGGKSETHLTATGADIANYHAVRRSVAADYLYDAPVQLGSLRAGPDLANIGARQGDAKIHLQHLYAPSSVAAKSAMPSYKFLFEVRKQINGATSPDALNLPAEFAPAAGYEVVPKLEAKQLVAYLLSLRADAPLYEAPFSPTTTKP